MRLTFTGHSVESVALHSCAYGVSPGNTGEVAITGAEMSQILFGMRRSLLCARVSWCRLIPTTQHVMQSEERVCPVNGVVRQRPRRRWRWRRTVCEYSHHQQGGITMELAAARQ